MVRKNAARPKRDHICGRLGQNEEYGHVDVCKRPEGHRGQHHGQWRGMVWEDVPGRRDKANIVKPGGTYIHETGGNIRGNP